MCYNRNMSKNTCSGCGEEFVASRKSKMYCDTPCKNLGSTSGKYNTLLKSIGIESRSILAGLEPEEKIQKAEQILEQDEGNLSIYFVVAFDVNRVKIGIATLPDQRVKDMQTGSPCKLEIKRIVKNKSMKGEKLLHALFWDQHEHGEWFNISEELEEVIFNGHLGDDVLI